ncbi:MAG: lipid-A-disaccharide synthase [Acholeplasmataceae bacterium]|nr:lipid-A-disaccharide synthase [Acholeplasmataceae bacterium]
MKILLSAGEASGDLHAAALTKAILALEPTAEIYGMGGEAMRAAGGEVVFDIKDHGVMGIVEVIRKLPQLYKLKKDFRKLMQDRRPDCFVTIDYPDFNMRIASMAKEMGIPIVAYIAPSAWVWRKGRARDVAKLVNKVASIFPFEYDLYKAAGADVEFVGHPLVDIVKLHISETAAKAKAGKRDGHPLILLLPGSRIKEIKNMLPPMLKALKIIKAKNPGVDFVVPRASTIPLGMLKELIAVAGVEVHIVEGDTYDIMSVADVALATSGTVTLEAALCGLPSVICYKTSAITVAIARCLVRIPHIGLPNIVAGRQILPELIQEEMTPDNMAKEVLNFLEPSEHARIRKELKDVVKKLGKSGAVERVAKLILKQAGEHK